MGGVGWAFLNYESNDIGQKKASSCQHFSSLQGPWNCFQNLGHLWRIVTVGVKGWVLGETGSFGSFHNFSVEFSDASEQAHQTFFCTLTSNQQACSQKCWALLWWCRKASYSRAFSREMPKTLLDLGHISSLPLMGGPQISPYFINEPVTSSYNLGAGSMCTSNAFCVFKTVLTTK